MYIIIHRFTAIYKSRRAAVVAAVFAAVFAAEVAAVFAAVVAAVFAAVVAAVAAAWGRRVAADPAAGAAIAADQAFFNAALSNATAMRGKWVRLDRVRFAKLTRAPGTAPRHAAARLSIAALAAA